MAKKDIETGTGKRSVMGKSAYALVDAPSAKAFANGMVVPKKGGGVGKPDAATANAKSQAHATGQDRMGPRFAISASIPNAPEAALNQRNTVFMKSAVNRSQPNFNLGRLG